MRNGSKEGGQVGPFCVTVTGKFRYLITNRQEVVVGPESSQAGRIQLGFERLAIS